MADTEKLIVGTEGADSLTNAVTGVTIQALGGNDTVENTGNNDGQNYSLGSADDTNYTGHFVSIDGGANDDLITNEGGNDVTITANAGNDTIYNHYGYKPLIYGGAGNDSINVSRGHLTSVDAGSGNDTIIGSLRNDSLITNDWTFGENALILGGTGNDYISPDYTNNSSIDGGTGNDSIITSGANSSLSGGDGHDYIYNKTSNNSAGTDNVIINGGMGKDTIINETDYANITGGTNNDSITNSGQYATIDGGAGNDTIIASGANSSLSGGEGHDYIYNKASNDSADTDNIVINGGMGKDTIINEANYANITGDTNNDSISNSGKYVTIDGGTAKDYIENTGENVLVKGGDGNDSIKNNGSNVTIFGNAGDDSIALDSDATANVIVYKLNDGNDVISGFNATTTLQIGDGTTGYVSQKSGDDVLVTVGAGTITLSGAASLESVNINGTLTDAEPESLTGAATGITYAMLQRTAAGYPSLAGYLFHPDDYTDEEPTNYSTKDTWTITSADGLKLEGFYYAPENASDKWALIIHGYGHNHKHVYPYAASYLDNGYNVLLIDQRAAGESEGEWLTMGAAESADIALWTQEIASRYPDSKITLHGFSMGAATAMLAAARADIKNVTSLVEDCGYTNAMTLVNTLWKNYPFVSALLEEKAVPYMDVAAKDLTGYSLSSAAPLDSISAAKMPTLFINGTNDSVVSTEVLDTLYDASGATVKEKFIVEGAEHAMSAFVDPVGYANTIFRFNAEANGEGWSKNNSVPSILLTGTKYADTFINSGSSVTIDALGGKDSIENIGDNDGYNYSLTADEVTAGNYTGHYVSINGGAGVDFITNEQGNNVTITAGAGNDIIYNHHGYKPMIYGGSGNDSINVSRGNLTSVDGGAGNDTIIGSLRNDSLITNDWTFGRLAVVSGGTGNDYINPVYSDNSSLDGGKGNDTIITSGENTTITGGDGNDLIQNNLFEGSSTDYVSIVGGAGNDSISSETNIATLDGGKGNDSISNRGSQVSIDSGTGDDYVYNNGENVTIATGIGNDTIFLGENVTAVNIENFSRKDVLQFTSEVTSIETSSDSLIVVAGEQTVTVGGLVSDSVGANWSLDGSRASCFEQSIKGAYITNGNIKFKDTVKTSNAPVIVLDGISSTDMDVKYKTVNIAPENFAGDKASIVSNNGNYGVLLSGVFNNQTFTGTKGADTITFQGASLTVDAGLGNDSIINSGGDYSYLNGGKGDDTIENLSGISLTIKGYNGNDSIVNHGASNTLLGGAGNDIITSDGQKVSINAGSGNDSIMGDGDNTTILGSLGDDQISLGSGAALVMYNSGDGNDTIYGLKPNDTLSIAGGEYSTETSGEDVIFTVGEGKITLVGAAKLPVYTVNDSNDTLITGTAYADTIVNSGSKVTINALDGNDSISNAEGKNVSLNAGKGNDTIYNFHAYYPTLLGSAGNDSIGLARGEHIYADGGSGKDTITGILISDAKDEWGTGNYATVLGGTSNDLLKVGYSNYSSIDGGAGNDTLIATGKSTTLNGGAGKNLISIPSYNYDTSNYVVLNGQTTVKGFKADFGEYSDTVYIAGAAPAVDFKEGGLSFYYDNDSLNSLTFSDITSTQKLNLYYAEKDALNTYVFIADNEWYNVNDGEAQYYVGATAKINHGIDFSGISKAVDVTLNTDYESTTANFWINNIHSIKGGAGKTTITGSNKADTIIAGKGATTINAGAGKDRISLSSGKALVNYSAGDGKDIIYGFGTKSTLNISGAPYSSQVSGSNVIVTVDKNKITLSGAASLSKLNISGVAEADVLKITDGTPSPVTLDSKVEVIDSSERTTLVQIIGNSKNNSINGGSNADTIFGNSGNDTIFGRNGNDSLLGDNGNDVLTGDAGNDTLDGGAGKDSIWGGAGNDNLLGGTGNDVLSGEAGNDTLDGGTGNDSIWGGAGNDNLLGGTGNDVLNGETGNDSLDGGTGNDSIWGDAGNDYLFGNVGNDLLEGNAGNDTLWGGSGNDSLYGGDGKDTFIYKPGEGTDTIFDYASGDLLKILKSDGTEGGSFKSSSFSDGDLTLTINGGGKVIFNGVANGDKFDINSKTYTISDQKLK